MYALPDVCVLMGGIHPITLRRWIARAGVKTLRNDADMRFRYLRDEDVLRLARDHHRVVANGDVARLAAEVAELKKKVAEMGK